MKTVYEIVDKDNLRVKSSLKRILSFLDEINMDDNSRVAFRKLLLDEINGLVREIKNGD